MRMMSSQSIQAPARIVMLQKDLRWISMASRLHGGFGRLAGR
jgi:hypothetical protein